MDAKRNVGTVGSLWRYPVKSMLGERLEEMLVTPFGALGDRAWALRDPRTGRIASAKKYPALLNFRAHYDTPPTMTEPGTVVIEMPDGRVIPADHPETADRISHILGLALRLECNARDVEKTGIVRETVFGDVPVSKFKPEWTLETMPDHFQLKTGSFFEIASIFIISSGSIEHLRVRQGGTALIDQRRFRPNVYVQSDGPTGEFVEDAWLGRSLKIGGSVTIGEFTETVWCVMSTLPQAELPRDLSILRTIADEHNGRFGVYGTVKAAGAIRVGDSIALSNSLVNVA